MRSRMSIEARAEWPEHGRSGSVVSVTAGRVASAQRACLLGAGPDYHARQLLQSGPRKGGGARVVWTKYVGRLSTPGCMHLH